MRQRTIVLHYYRTILLFPGCLSVVSEEFLQADVCKWVLQQALESAEAAGDDVGTGAGGIDDVLTVTDGGGEDFGFVLLDFVDLSDLFDQLHAVPADVVNAAYEGAYVGGTSLSGKDGLAGAEHEGTVGPDALGGTPRECLHTFADHGNLDDDVVGNLHQFLGFFLHALEIGADYFCAHVSAGDVTDFFVVRHDGFGATDFFLGHQAGVGGHTVENTEGFGFGNVVEVGGIDEELHAWLFLLLEEAVNITTALMTKIRITPDFV